MEWRTLARFPNYEVSSDGQLRNRRNNRIIAGYTDKDGYPTVKFLVEGKRRRFFIHRLCCEAFHGPQPAGRPEVAHWDGNPANNHRDNLRWASAQENADDKARHFLQRTKVRRIGVCKHVGKYNVGVHNPRAKLNDEQVRLLRECRCVRGAVSQLAKQFGVTRATAYNAARSVTWGTIS